MARPSGYTHIAECLGGDGWTQKGFRSNLDAILERHLRNKSKHNGKPRGRVRPLRADEK